MTGSLTEKNTQKPVTSCWSASGENRIDERGEMSKLLGLAD